MKATIVRVWAVALLLGLALAGPAAAFQSPYTSPDLGHPVGTVKAYGADGAEIDVSYYDRVGGGTFPSLIGSASNQTWNVAWVSGEGGGPAPESIFQPLDSSCLFQQGWPYRTFPEEQDRCWLLLFNPHISTPGTYSIVMPLTVQVDGQTQVFHDWDVQGALVEGHCRTGDLGRVNTNLHESEPGRGFIPGVEYAIWTDYHNDFLGFGADIAAGYATVSPDVSAPLFWLNAELDCATVERGEPLVATYSCEEPGGLGSGIASCVMTGRAGPVQSGQSLDTSTVGTHSFTLTATDNAGNTRSRTETYTVVEGTTTLTDATADENQPTGTAVGALVTSNPGSGSGWTYELIAGEGADDNTFFTIDGATLRTAEMFDYEYRSSYAIRVRATDAGTGISLDYPFTITIANVPDLSATHQHISENLPAGTLVGLMRDVRPGNSASWSTLSFVAGEGDDDNAAFEVRMREYDVTAWAPGRIWELFSAESFDFETKSVYRIRIKEDFHLSSIPDRENSLVVGITDANDTPVAEEDHYVTDQDTVLSVAVSGVLGNDSDEDDDALQAQLVTEPAHGTVDLGSDGAFTYTPASGFSGQDEFTYRASDGTATSAETTVTITVRPATAQYTLTGFFSPVDADVLNTVKGGSTVPMKFRLHDGATEITDPTALNPFTVKSVPCTAGESAVTEEIEFRTSGPSQLRYVDGAFQQNWKTPKVKGCYQVTITTQGDSLTANFRLR